MNEKIIVMKNAVVTGVSSGIGRACACMLADEGYRIFGISRDPVPPAGGSQAQFVSCPCDLTDRQALIRVCASIREQTGKKLHVLLNCAGVGHFAPHEELSQDAIHEMVALNLEAPMMLANIFLRDIRAVKGFVINVASVTAMHPAPRGSAYGATKAGLLHFSRSLFEESRRAGVKVVSIVPDITKTPFFDNLDFGPGMDEESYIEPRCIADAVKNVLSQRSGTVITEMVIRPQRFSIIKKHASL